MIHARFIDQLGGAPELARLLDLPANVTGNWRGRPTGVAWPWRAQVAQIAAEKGVPLPEGFLDPRLSHAADKPSSRRSA